MKTHKVLVFTDTHVTNPDKLLKGRDTAAQLDGILTRAAIDHPDADCAVIAGDLTHWGGPGEYTNFRTCLGDRPWPVHLMLGNHDNRDQFSAAFPDVPRTASGHIQQVVDLGNWRLILLDSYDETYTAPVHSGILCPARMDWLKEALDGAAGRDVLVFIHHPPMRTFFDGMDEIGLRNADELLALLARHSGVRHVICGHIHRTISGTASGIPVTAFRSTSHQSPLGLGDARTDQVTDDPPSYGLVLLHGGGVTCHTIDVP